MVDFDDLHQRTSTVRSYIDALSEKDRDLIMEEFEDYDINEGVLRELKERLEYARIVVFSAPWCGDCKRAMPLMLHLEENLELDIMVFGSLKTAPLDPDRQWATPPSPPEANDWNVKAIPWLVFFDEKGNEIGILIEKPKVKKNLEEEILHILKS
jgi:thiol-disulfide isomerase/thioredoxin